jgi:hypothetical protein
MLNHLHSWDVSTYPRSLELVLLPLRQKVVDGILQFFVMCAVPSADSLPCSISYNIAASRLECWTHVLANHIWPVEDFHNCSVLSRPRHEILLILNSGVVMMPMHPSRSHSLPMGIITSFPKVFISSASWYIFSFSASLEGL